VMLRGGGPLPLSPPPQPLSTAITRCANILVRRRISPPGCRRLMCAGLKSHQADSCKTGHHSSNAVRACITSRSAPLGIRTPSAAAYRSLHARHCRLASGGGLEPASLFRVDPRRRGYAIGLKWCGGALKLQRERVLGRRGYSAGDAAPHCGSADLGWPTALPPTPILRGGRKVAPGGAAGRG